MRKNDLETMPQALEKMFGTNKLVCDHCGHKMDLKKFFSGKKQPCPGCGPKLKLIQGGKSGTYNRKLSNSGNNPKPA